jgi:hypothetical protein
MSPASGRAQSPKDIHRLVCAAVAHRQPIAVVYDGAPRLLCPHVLGRNRAGNQRMFCYQYGGDSKSGLRPEVGAGNWRCLALEKISSVEVLDAPWQTEPHAPQRCVENIEVDADHHPGGDPQYGQ